MALKKQVAALQIDKGLDTKFDARQQEAGYLRAAQNVVYETVKMLRKRNGYDLVDTYDSLEAAIENPVKLARLKDELLLLTDTKLYSYSETRARFVEKGAVSSVSAVTKTVLKNANSQSEVDALHLNGFNIFAWKDSSGGVRYSVQDTAKGSFIVSNALVETGAEQPVLANIDGKVFIIYGNGANLKFKTFSILSPQNLSSATTAATDRHLTLGLIDAESAADRVIVAYNSDNAGDDLSLFTISASSVVSSIVGVNSESASHALDVMLDAAGRIIVTFSDNTAVRYIIFPITLSASISGPTNINSIAGVTTCCSVEVSAGVYKVYYEVSVAGVGTNYIRRAQITSAGAVSGDEVFKRSVGLGARAFLRDDVLHIPTVLDSEIQSSYFIFNSDGDLVTKLANQVAAGPITYGVLQPVLETTTADNFMVPLIVHNRVQSGEDTFFSTDGIAATILDFQPDFKYSNAELADSLHICAGVLKIYDGASVSEHGFHVFPEVLTQTSPVNISVATTTEGVTGVSEVQKLSYSADAASGTYKLTIGAETTAALNWNDSNATIKAALEAFTAITTVTVTGSFTAATGHTITFDSPVQNFAQITITDNLLLDAGAAAITVTPTTLTEGVTAVQEVQTLSFSATPTSGSFTLDIGGETTTAVNYTQGATELQAAITALTGIVACTVTGSYAAGFTITITNPVAPVDTAIVVTNSLSNSNSVGELSDGTRSYVALYRWTDNTGKDHRSTPTLVPLQVTLLGGTETQQTTVSIPTLRVTEKENVVIEVYRTEDAGTTYYKVTDDLSPLLNDQTVDAVSFTDTVSDTDLISNQILYTTGGVLENIAAPACAQVTVHNGDRLAIVGEESNRVFFSKQITEGSPVEFTDAIYRDINPIGGSITAIQPMGDKLLIFASGACFYVSGDGPNNLGLQDSMNKPEIISTDIGCITPDSVVLTNSGVMFQSRKGIWNVTGGLGLEYVGARMEAFNAGTVTSAAIVGELNQIRFTLSEDRALVYNYNLDRWATFENHGALSAVVIENDYYYLREDGALYKENRTSFGDAGSPIRLKLETGWLSMADLQGFQRVKRALILGSFKSAHKIRVKVAYDFNDAVVQEVLINVADFMDVAAYGSDPTYGDSSPYGGTGDVEQMQVDFKRQKCQAIKFIIEDVQDAVGEGLSISGVTVLAAGKEGMNKMPQVRKYGTS